MHHFTYKTTNLINGKTYIGVHSTNDLDDGYIGCGVYSQAYAVASKKHGLKSAFIDAVVKYGYFNFSREILKFYDSAAEAYEDERKIVDYNFVMRKDTYNIQIGGTGGNKPDKMEPYYAKIQELFLQGNTLKEIGNKFNIGIAYVRSILRKTNTDYSERKITPSIYKKYANLIEPVKSAYIGGKSRSQIEREFNLDAKVVKSFLKGVERPEKYVGISPNGDIYKFDSPLKFSKLHGLKSSAISACAMRKNTHHRNWVFFFSWQWDGESKENLKVKKLETKNKGSRFINPDGTWFEIPDNLFKFCKDNNLCYEGLSSVNTGRAKQYKGIIKYEEKKHGRLLPQKQSGPRTQARISSRVQQTTRAGEKEG